MLSAAKHLFSAFQERFFALLRVTTLGGCGDSDRLLGRLSTLFLISCGSTREKATLKVRQIVAVKCKNTERDTMLAWTLRQ